MIYKPFWVDCAVQNDVREHFRKLVNDRFVEQCPAPEPFIAEPTPEETPAKKRGAKSTKVICDFVNF